MRLFHPLPEVVSRPATLGVLVFWLVTMGVLVKRSFLDAGPVSFAADLARYGSGAQWRGVYYRGEKIGFMVTQTVPTAQGFEIQEDVRLQMLLLGMTSAARMRTTVRVDSAFRLQSFSFSLDPGTGAVAVEGRLEGRRLHLTLTNPSGSRSETRELPEPPVLSLNLGRRLVSAGLKVGQRFEVPLFDPATLRNAPMSIEVVRREVVTIARQPVPVYRIEGRYSGLTTTSWMTDVGEVVREESPLGLIVIKESEGQAKALAVPGQMQTDMLKTAAVTPRRSRWRIDDSATVERLRVRLEGAGELLASADATGAGQTVQGDIVEVLSADQLPPTTRDPDAVRWLGPEALIESDAPEIRAEVLKVVKDVQDPRARAERLLRHVHALIDKRPTVSIPSALEVLRTRVGDCNEHAVLYVALARAAAVPARVAVGLVHLLGSFYYHAWVEVYIEGPPGRGVWIPVDPTLNQFPADATRIRLARGGLDRQAAILATLGRLDLTILDVRFQPQSTPVLVGRAPRDLRPMEIEVPRRTGARDCWSRPAS